MYLEWRDRMKADYNQGVEPTPEVELSDSADRFCSEHMTSDELAHAADCYYTRPKPMKVASKRRQALYDLCTLALLDGPKTNSQVLHFLKVFCIKFDIKLTQYEFDATRNYLLRLKTNGYVDIEFYNGKRFYKFVHRYGAWNPSPIDFAFISTAGH